MEGFELVSCHHAIKGYHENFIIFMEGSSEGALLLYSSMILWKGLLFLSQSKLHDKRSYLRFIISESTTETKWSLDFSDFSGFHHGHHQKKHHNISCLRNDPGPGWVVKAHPVFLGDGNRNRHTQRNNPHPGDTTLPYSWDWSPWAVSTRRKTCRKSFCPFKKGKNQEIQYITSIVLLASMASWSWFWRHIRTSPLRTTPNAIAKNQQLPQIRTRNTFIIKFQTRKNKKWIKLPTKLESSCYFQSLHVPRSMFFPNKK